ncbi:hypothetical protein SXCC_00396 [Gluconacetobacter sp. SXCC-1]|nr:hypothetical protein SXCC_00396 [Gluconacetobacter sp. SXCC-1]
MKLFAKASEERRLFEKRRHPKAFIVFYQQVVLKRYFIYTEAIQAKSLPRHYGAWGWL